MNSDQRLPKARNATAAATRELPSAPDKQGLSLDTESHKKMGVARSSDPYNTSGSFDRKKNWARIGKR